MKTLDELIDRADPAWPLVQEWIAAATNPVEVLPPPDEQTRQQALLAAQVTTRSPMGAIIFETGGLMVDHGWLRILGSGHPRLPRSLMRWNWGRSCSVEGQAPPFLLVADDVAGGFFAIDGGGLGLACISHREMQAICKTAPIPNKHENESERIHPFESTVCWPTNWEHPGFEQASREGAVLPQPAFPERRSAMDASGPMLPDWEYQDPGEKSGLERGKVCYHAPDSLKWENTGLGYSEFLVWSFQGDLAGYYADLRWPGWQDEMGTVGGDQALSIYPPLWADGPPVGERSRGPISLAEIYDLHVGRHS